jgi:hypothetical protein
MDATFILDPTEFGLSGTKIIEALDGGGGTVALTSASGAEHHTDTAGPYGAVAPSLRTDNIAGLLSSASGGPTGAKPFHLIMAVRSDDNAAGYHSFFGFGNMGAAQNLYLGVNTGQFRFFTDDGVVAGTFTMPNGPAQTVLTPGHDHIVEVQYDGATLSYWINGRHNLTTDQAVTLNVSDASINFGAWFAAIADHITSARIDFFALKVGGLFARPVLNVWIAQQLQRLGGTGIVLMATGDSTTAGGAAGTTPAHYLPLAIRDQATGAHVIYPQNAGLSGLRSDEVLNQLVIPHVDPITHAHVWVGVNDVAQSVSSARTFAFIEAIVGRFRARGAKVVVGTLPQWGALVADAARNALRIGINTLIHNNAASLGYTVADYDAAMGPYNPANFCADTLHENDGAVTGIVAPVGYAALIAA